MDVDDKQSIRNLSRISIKAKTAQIEQFLQHNDA
jgi:hypothetical protein